MTAGIQMPEYVSHKRVYALKIDHIEKLDTSIRLHFTDPAYAPIEVGYFKLRINEGDDPGYYVQYADGYESWSPTKAFEEGYTPVGE